MPQTKFGIKKVEIKTGVNQPNTSQSILENLPKDLLDNELLLLDQKELGKVAQISTKLNQAVKEARKTLPLSLKIPRKIGQTELAQEQLTDILNQYIPLPPQKAALRELDLSRISNLVNNELLSFIEQHFPHLQILNIEYSNINDVGLKNLNSLASLQSLNLANCKKITDAGVESLSSLTKLQTLNLHCCSEITDVGLRHLSLLTALQTLNLSWCRKITDEGIGSLKSLIILQELNLNNCDQITDLGLIKLSTLTTLQDLILSRCELITDEGIGSLSSLTTLRNLKLGGCIRITDEGVKILSSLPSLKILDFAFCEITDEGIKSLKGSALNELNLSFCNNISKNYRKYFRSRAELIEAGICIEVQEEKKEVFNSKISPFANSYDSTSNSKLSFNLPITSPQEVFIHTPIVSNLKTEDQNLQTALRNRLESKTSFQENSDKEKVDENNSAFKTVPEVTNSHTSTFNTSQLEEPQSKITESERRRSYAPGSPIDLNLAKARQEARLEATSKEASQLPKDNNSKPSPSPRNAKLENQVKGKEIGKN